ncbi:uncharacterized protein CELE_F32A7.8 [Caenorhabditis elegans]|uniref:Transmembrane protein n=1 Tax=Caenorhabditis elegans TaxID=6239 RepID=Q564S6_CAEEL|nr:Transmembrane protein [Caenorhabditis elegans]CAI79246.1 Transmembrane protein [Caenorhabditis elegans]|eukprot:NP_001021439.1 Uncharacterized protein CELE_F32A7.8 [Caenorhabditis elegans]
MPRRIGANSIAPEAPNTAQPTVNPYRRIVLPMKVIVGLTIMTAACISFSGFVIYVVMTKPHNPNMTVTEYGPL